GTGPLQKIIAECTGNGEVRGYTAHPQIVRVLGSEGPVPSSVGEALGREGTLFVTRGRLGEEPYRTINQFADGEIASDVTKYLAEADQIPSAVAAGVKLSAEGEVLGAGAVLVQQLGGQLLKGKELKMLETKMAEVGISDRIAAGES